MQSIQSHNTSFSVQLSPNSPFLSPHEITIERYLNHPERFFELSSIVNEPEIKNTGLTCILAREAFVPYDIKIDYNLNVLLDQLVFAALNNNQAALDALTLPNNPGFKILLSFLKVTLAVEVWLSGLVELLI